MQFNLSICAAAAILLGLSGLASTASAQSGSYQATCRNIQNYGNALTADCRDPSGRYHTSSINPGQCRGDIGNNNGVLFCNTGDNRGGGDNRGFMGLGGPQVSGSFQRTCRNIRIDGDMLTADCADPSGRHHTSSMAYARCNGDIGNNNGELFCNGPSGGGNYQNGQGNGGYGGGNGQGGGRDQGRGR